MMTLLRPFTAFGFALACLLLLVLIPSSAFSRPNELTSMSALKTQCEAGDVDYCVELAENYKQGIRLPKRPDEAMRMFEASCDQNNTKACLKVGLAYYHGEIVQKNLTKAMQFNAKACSGNDAAACRNIGVMFATGSGVAPDADKSKEFFQKGCRLGLTKACVSADLPSPYVADMSRIRVTCQSAASCLQAGYQSVGGSDIKPTLANFKRACDYKSAEACFELAEILDAKGAYELASEGYQQSCELDNTDACVALAMYYIEGKVTKNENRGIKILESLCEKNDPNLLACQKAAHRFYSEYEADYLSKSSHRNYVKAAKYGRIACFASVNPILRECAQLGHIYSTGGFGVEPDPAKAFEAYSRGCSADNYGSISTCDEAGLQLLRGEGVLKDTAQAITLFETGCRLENYNACYLLAVEYDRGVNIPADRTRAGGLYKYICEPTHNSHLTFRNCAAAVSIYESDFQFSQADKIIDDICETTNFFRAEEYSAPENSCVAFEAARSMHQCEMDGESACLENWEKSIESLKKAENSVTDPLQPRTTYTPPVTAEPGLKAKPKPLPKTTSKTLNMPSTVTPLRIEPKDACAGISGEECFQRAIDYNVGKNGVSRDLRKARDLFVHACRNGHAQACELAADGYRSSEYVLKADYNMETARQYFMMACDFGRADGCFYAAGTYPSPEYDKTMYDGEKLPLLKRACEMGSRGGCNDVDRINNTGDYAPR